MKKTTSIFLASVIVLISFISKAQRPTITSFTPVKGNVGTSVVITGTNFNVTPANNIVFFGAVRASVNTATSTSLNVTVPSGATHACITVLNTVNALSSASKTLFLPTYSPNKGSIVSTDFLPKADFAVGGGAHAVLLGDLDVDGKPDIVTVNAAGSSISIRPNTSTGGSISFATPANLSLLPTHRWGCLSDLDGDGKMDLIVATGGTTFSVFRNTSTTGSISFATKVDFTTGVAASCITAGDINNDGKPDVAVTIPGTNTVSVFRNTGSLGSISFAAKVDFTTGAMPQYVYINDLDLDGRADMLTANLTGNSMSVFYNMSLSGSVAFSAKTDYTTGQSPEYLAVGDIDGNGVSDIVVTNGDNDSLAIFRNISVAGAITLVPKIDITTGDNPKGVTLGDIDGDGKADMMVVNSQNNNVSVYRNISGVGSISFLPRINLTTGNTPFGLAVGDVNADGKPDITATNDNSGTMSVIGNNSQLSTNANLASLLLSLGTLSPAFSPAVTSYTDTLTVATTFVTPAVEDATATIQVRLNGGTFNTITSGAASSTFNLIAGVNAIDVRVTAQNGSQKTYVLSVTRLLPPVITSFAPSSGLPGASVTISGSNFNTTASNNIIFFGATRATVSVASANSLTVTVPSGATYGAVTVLNTVNSLTAFSKSFFNPTFTPNKGSIAATDFDAPVTFSTPSTPHGIATADLDGDGKPDLVTANHNAHSISVFRNTGSGNVINFAAKIDFQCNDNPENIAIGDINGDGKPEIVSANFGGGFITVHHNTSTPGSISFNAGLQFTVGAGPRVVTINDFDSDGRADIAVVNEFHTNISVLRNTGTLTTFNFAAPVNFPVGTTPTYIVSGDIDGDGKPDLAATNINGSNVSVYRNTSTNSNISFAAIQNFAAATSPVNMVIADADGDGKSDLVINSYSANCMSVFRNTGSIGTISFAARVDFFAGDRPEGLSAGDLDGDGKVDFALANYLDEKRTLMRNTGISGTASFNANVTVNHSARPYGVVTGDFTGDGKPDIAITNDDNSTISVIKNNPVYSSNANLSALAVNPGTLSPSFNPATTTYASSVTIAPLSATVTPTAADPTATIAYRLNGGSYSAINSGSASASLTLIPGINTIDVKVTAQNGTTIKTYSITVNACPTSSFNNVGICSTALPYTWNGSTFTQQGIYIVHLTNAAGCDSAATLNLTVNPPPLAPLIAGVTASCPGNAVVLTASSLLARNAVTFDGADDHIVETTSGVDLANTSFTVECWIKRASFGTPDIFFSQGGNGTLNQTLHLGFRDNNVFTFAFWANDLNTTVTTTDMNWHHWACTFNNSTKLRTIYRDGIIVGQDVATGSFAGSGNTHLYIGSIVGINYFFHGTLDELRVWNVEKSQGDIQSGISTGMPVSAPALVSYFKFDEGAGTVATNNSNGHTATLTNGVQWQTGSNPPIRYNSYTWMPGSLNGSNVTVFPSTNTTYTVTGTDANGCTGTAAHAVTMLSQGCDITFNLKIYIEGYYAGNGMMRPFLYTTGLSGDQSACDSITVSLHNPFNVSDILATRSVVLHTDGTVSLQLPAGLNSSSAYISVKHRNSLEAWSKLPVTLGVVTDFDFTIP